MCAWVKRLGGSIAKDTVGMCGRGENAVDYLGSVKARIQTCFRTVAEVLVLDGESMHSPRARRSVR